MTARNGKFDPGNLRRVEGCIHEEIIPGDFVTLASGSPKSARESATVVFLTDAPFDMTLNWRCFRPAR